MAEASILIGGAAIPPRLLLRQANRHGLIAGATGTGKTVSLQVLAEGFSAQGVPVFMADVKGDLAGLAESGKPHPKIAERITKIGLDAFAFGPSPVIFWDLFGRQGHPIRTTISEMGPLLLAQLMNLNETQEGVLNIAFRVADEQGLLLLDLKDLRAMLAHVSRNSKSLSATYGNVSPSSVGAIQRRLLVLEQQRAEEFFGEPALDIRDFIRTTPDGRGLVNILAAHDLMEYPRLYATFLLWLLSELFEELPEVGDPDKPKLVFFFDEAHLLFRDAPKGLLEKVERVVRLVRSKGVGVYFVTQNPLDIPDEILGQLGHRVQHALRAFTPRDQKAVRAAAQTFRRNPELDTVAVLGALGTGEALVSVLDEKGRPTVVQRTLVCPPRSQMGPITAARRKEILERSPLRGRYDTEADRESAYEQLAVRAQAGAAVPGGKAAGNAAGQAARKGAGKSSARTASKASGRGRSSQSIGEAVAKSTLRSLGTQLGRGVGSQIVRGVLGSILKRR